MRRKAGIILAMVFCLAHSATAETPARGGQVEAASTEGKATVYPDQNTHVVFSATGINHIICDAGIWDVDGQVDGRKGIQKVEKVTPTEILVEFKWRENAGKIEFKKTETDIHLFCGGERYVVIAAPADVPPVFVHLSPGHGGGVAQFFKGPLTEESVVLWGNDIYLGQVKKPLTDKKAKQVKVDLFENLDLWRIGSFDAPGLRYELYEARYTGKGEVYLDADDLMRKLGNDERNVALTSSRWRVSAADEHPFRIIVVQATGKVLDGGK